MLQLYQIPINSAILFIDNRFICVIYEYIDFFIRQKKGAVALSDEPLL